MLLGAWLLHAIRLAAALGMAIMVMQAPAVTREYQAALLQLMRSSGEDIAQRKASAQRFYGIPIENEESIVTRLRAVEPSNAETFAAALAREKSLRASYDRSGVRSPKRCSGVSRRSSICRLPQRSAALRACSWAR
jgi:hypothetical protein